MREPVESPTVEDSPSQLREYLAILRVRRWSIVSITALVMAAALVFSFQQTPVYQARADVLVLPIVLTLNQAVQEPNMANEATIAHSNTFAQQVVETLDIPEDPNTLRSGLTLSVATGTEILQFTYSHPDPLEAQRRAQAFATTYLNNRRQRAIDSLLSASEPIQERTRRLNEALTLANHELATTADPARRANLQAEVNSLISQISILQQQLSSLATSENLRVGEIVETAQLPSSPASPNHVTNGLVALLVGAAAGVGLAFLRERLDDRLQGREDLETRAGAPTLAVVPTIHAWTKATETPLVAATNPKSSPAEAYRTLRTGLTFLAAQHGVKTLLVTSPQSGEGKTATVANLGVVLADSGKRVVIVSADLRKPRLHRFFGASNNRGLSNILTDETHLMDALVRGGVKNLRLVPSGPVPSAPADVLGSEAMANVLTNLREMADLVLIDSPPVLVVADATTLARHADAVLLVADAETTTRGSVTDARQQLEQVDAFVLGSVLNNFDPATARSSPYYYRYYYSYRYEEPSPPEEPREEAAQQRGMWLT
ncbi:MAG: polysaccharide biosynthesis tyrosine autokinase [Actinomycetota bacterium]